MKQNVVLNALQEDERQSEKEIGKLTVQKTTLDELSASMSKQINEKIEAHQQHIDAL